MVVAHNYYHVFSDASFENARRGLQFCESQRQEDVAQLFVIITGRLLQSVQNFEQPVRRSARIISAFPCYVNLLLNITVQESRNEGAILLPRQLSKTIRSVLLRSQQQLHMCQRSRFQTLFLTVNQKSGFESPRFSYRSYLLRNKLRCQSFSTNGNIAFLPSTVLLICSNSGRITFNQLAESLFASAS